MKIKKDLIFELAEDIMLEITDKEAEDFLKIENQLLEKFNKAYAINIEGVEPSHYCFDYANTFLRDDDDIRKIDKQDFLKNAPKKDNDYVVIEKVVK
ncbi:Asp-tRNA(Asn)/Glu-tRNA(Gln) amidotransferase subunit GatC [Spiroplasma tabanidicola]|uniref:Glutamyl-tRNA(Gln) amidotransferase subunit C n=1 Tax=Spiroplasma tabanidicola TaxID=324079 RepID=A0A6I6C5Z6_9MOLU|nr:Asp-tRNA(Asn)/Glu-tRNA(Gln) amidotransferase subunit GatC [Spiroplasma tabanidicola]QGS51570.1 glutamyl-tRNA(Gln) amidotransferase subunit C [Spiroplasma tabanidicola]